MALTSLLRFCRDERVVLVGIGVATVTMVSLMTQALVWVRDENEVKATPPKTQYITQETEDALQLDTLNRLLAHSSYSIRDIATKILCDRAVNDAQTMHVLLYNITQPDYDTRMQSLRALAILTGQTHEGISELHNWKAYTALVRSLELCLGDVEPYKLDDKHWDEYHLRDMAERFCLMFLIELTSKYDAEMLVRAKFVEKWLAKQNWGGDNDERRRNYAQYMDNRRNRIVDIATRVGHTREGKKALRASGLTSPSKTAAAAGSEDEDDVATAAAAMGLDAGGSAFSVVLRAAGAAAADEQVPRSREHSVEEQRLRRQHREAMVFNDGTRPIGRGDIIERSHNTTP